MKMSVAESSVAAEEGESDSAFEVVVNQEDQYSIWPAGRAVPAGWRLAGERGTRAACLAYIAAVWTDMRPASLRRKMDGGSAP